MNAPTRPPTIARPPAEQLRYAAWLDATAKLGFVILVVGYLAYLFGLLAPQVPLSRLPGLWKLSAAEFMRATGSPNGWGWLSMLDKADLLNLLGIAILAGGSLACLLAVMPLYARRGERVYVLICSLQIVVLLLAASGLLTVGH